MSNLEIGDVVDFQLIADGLINSSFKKCTYQGTTGYIPASGMDSTVNSMHNAFYSYFKDKYPDYQKASDYQYMLFTLPNGQIKPIGVPWILDGTLTIDSNRTGTITIHNYRGVMESPLRDLLAKLGADFSFETKSH